MVEELDEEDDEEGVEGKVDKLEFPEVILLIGVEELEEEIEEVEDVFVVQAAAVKIVIRQTAIGKRQKLLKSQQKIFQQKKHPQKK